MGFGLSMGARRCVLSISLGRFVFRLFARFDRTLAMLPGSAVQRLIPSRFLSWVGASAFGFRLF